MTGLRHIAIDGKAVRAAPGDTFSGCLHLVNAWAAENRLILGQESVPAGTHEIAAIPEFLKILALKGALVTIDAAGFQKEIAKHVRGEGGDYLLAVKGNQPSLQEAVLAVFDQALEVDFAGVEHDGHEQAKDGHGRHEERYVTVIYDPTGLPADWPDVAAVILVGRERMVRRRTNTRSLAHYYITSLRGTAEELGRLVRRRGVPTLDSGDHAARRDQRLSHSGVSAAAIRPAIPSRLSTHQPRPATFSRRPIRRARLSTPPLPIDRPVRSRP